MNRTAAIAKREPEEKWTGGYNARANKAFTSAKYERDEKFEAARKENFDL
jgi:hypothetical protein